MYSIFLNRLYLYLKEVFRRIGGVRAIKIDLVSVFGVFGEMYSLVKVLKLNSFDC